MTDMLDLAARAVETAKEWDYLLDYSGESIASLEELARMFYKTNKSQHLPKNVLWNVAAIYGAYLGETLLRNGLKDLGFSWVEDEDGDPALGRGENRMYPVSKVYKRITEGPEDSLESFYDISMALARGDIEL